MSDREAEPLNEHVGVIASIHAHAEKRLSAHQRLVERVTSWLGRPRTIYLLLGVVLAWALGNAVAGRMGRASWDGPPFFWLQGAVALYAALVSTMVLITQTRQQRHTEQRAYLELQINLTSEQKTAKLIALLEELRRDMPSVRDRVDLQANAMAQAVDPEAVLTAL